MTRFALALFALAALASPALAQTVTVHDLTVNGDPPPDEYRTVLNAAIETSVVPIRACYARELATHPGLHGDLRLRLWVSARQVIRVTPETSVGDTALETCAHDRVHEFTLPPQAPEGGAQVRFTMTFTPPAFVIDRVHGALSQEALDYVFRRAGLEQCTTTGHGAVPVTVSVDHAGHATATVAARPIRDAAYRTCVQHHITSATFPSGTAATRLRITITVP